jgi:branched-chain amino acid transport system permease protein
MATQTVRERPARSRLAPLLNGRNLGPRAAAAIVVGVAIAIPLWQGGFTLFLATESVTKAIAAVGLALLIAYAGLLSLGHAAFFGLAGYGVAFLTMHVTASPLLTLTVPVLAAVLYAALTGPFALRSHGIFFVMITLAFAQLLYAVAEQWIDITRGSDGISGIPRPDWFTSRPSLYLLSVATLLFVLWLGGRIVRSPMGRVVSAGRQNELKTNALGYSVMLYRYVIFLVSAGITGLGGALHVHHRGFVSPRSLFWVTSGILVVMVLLGGGRTLIGAAIGAIAFTHLESWFTNVTDFWELMVGLLLIAAVLTGYGRSLQHAAVTLWHTVRPRPPPRGAASGGEGRDL